MAPIYETCRIGDVSYKDPHDHEDDDKEEYLATMYESDLPYWQRLPGQSGGKAK